MDRLKERFAILLMILLAVSCTTADRTDDLEPSSGLMQIEVITPGADEHDYIRKVRFVVFNNASLYPELDINQAVPVDEEAQGAKVFRTTLKVSQHKDKMLIVIVNEPENLTPALDRILLPWDAENLMFDMGIAFDPSGGEPAPTGIPMSGVKRGISVTKDNDTEATAQPVSLTIERSVARVELWLQAEPGITASITNSTQVSLRRTCNQGFLATGTLADGTRFQTGEDAKNNFGHMLDIGNPMEDIDWVHQEWEPLVLGDELQRVVVFYTPERRCDIPDDTNKLLLDLINVQTSEGLRDARVVLKEFTPETGTGIETVTEIRRNNIYRIIGTVKSRAIDFSNRVASWNEEGVDLEVEY